MTEMSGRVLSDRDVTRIEEEWGYGWMQSMNATMQRYLKFHDMVPDLIATIRDRDKTIAELNNRIDEMGEVGLENDELRKRLKENGLAEALKKQNRILRQGLRQLGQHNALMLSALETIKTYERCGELHGQTCASIARDAIAQVKVNNVADIIKFPYGEKEYEPRIIRTGGGIWYANANCPKCNGTGKCDIEDCECVRFTKVANPFGE